MAGTEAGPVEDFAANPMSDDKLHEECGVFGIFGHADAAALTTLGLHALQHRGQEAAGIVSYDGKQFFAERHRGQSVLAFTHGGVLDVVYRAAKGRALDAPCDFLLPNAALNWLENSDGGWRLISWADCAHLQQALDELPG